MADGFDVAVLGGGIAGLTAARVVRAADRSVLLVEQASLGGQNVWSGSVPAGALRHAAAARQTMTWASSLGIQPGEIRTDFASVMEYVRQTVETLAASDSAEALEKSGVTVAHGRGRFVDRRTVQIGRDQHRVRRAIICTGSHADIPEIEGLSDVPFLTPESFFSLQAQPGHLLVLGAGGIALELAQTFRRLGSEVTVIMAGNRVLPREDPEIAAAVRSYLERDRITFVPGTTAVRLQSHGDIIRLVVTPEGRYRTIEADALLVAAGRRANVEDLGLELLNLEYDGLGIVTDATMKTTTDGIYAAGDVTAGRHELAHVAAYEARVAAYNAVGQKARADEEGIPTVVFLEPAVARVGLTEPEARGRYGDEIAVSMLPYTAIDRAVIDRRVEGFVKLIAARRARLGRRSAGETIVGGHIIGAGAAELIHELAMAMRADMTTREIAQAVHAYPTYSTGIQQAAGLFYAGERATTDLRRDLLNGG